MIKKSIYKIQILLKSDMDKGYFIWRRKYINAIPMNSPYSDKCFRQMLYRKSKHAFYIQ
jgi:hypothetical protein